MPHPWGEKCIHLAITLNNHPFHTHQRPHSAYHLQNPKDVLQIPPPPPLNAPRRQKNPMPPSHRTPPPKPQRQVLNQHLRPKRRPLPQHDPLRRRRLRITRRPMRDPPRGRQTWRIPTATTGSEGAGAVLDNITAYRSRDCQETVWSVFKKLEDKEEEEEGSFLCVAE